MYDYLLAKASYSLEVKNYVSERSSKLMRQIWQSWKDRRGQSLFSYYVRNDIFVYCFRVNLHS